MCVDPHGRGLDLSRPGAGRVGVPVRRPLAVSVALDVAGGRELRERAPDRPGARRVVAEAFANVGGREPVAVLVEPGSGLGDPRRVRGASTPQRSC